MKSWAQLNRESLRFVNYADSKLIRVLRRISIDHANNVKDYGENAILSQSNIKKKIENGYKDIYEVAGIAAAKNQIALTKSLIKGIKTKEEVETLETGWRRRMREFAVNRCAERIGAVTRNMYQNIEQLTKQVIAEAADEGWGAARVGREITKRTRVIDKMRAMRIARTEVISAQNEGSHMGAGSFSTEQVKVWRASMSGDYRDDHEAIDGERVNYNESFVVGGEELEYPGDPAGSPENVINCRCRQIYLPKESVIDELLN